MSTAQPPRSVRFSDDERGAWSSDRPRRDGAAARPADISTRCRILTPSDRLRYSPGSLLLLVSPSAAERDRFATRVLEDRNAYLTLDKVRALIAGRVPAEQAEERAGRLARLDRLWPWAKLAIVLLVVAIGGAAYTASATLRRQAQTDRWARTLAQELEDKKRAALTERQESAKRILDLETKLRSIEARLGPRVVIGGRSGS
jgi:hypothetical protein